MSNKMNFLLLLLIPQATAQISAFFESAPPCIKDCTPLWSVNYNCMQKGRVDISCLCNDDLMNELYAGSTCSCAGALGDEFRQWLDGPNICSAQQASYDATAVKTTSSTPTSTKSSSLASKTSSSTGSKTTSNHETITPMPTGTKTGDSTATGTHGALATSEADNSSGGSWSKKKKWAVPVIAVVVVGAIIGFLLLAFCLWRRRRNNRTLAGYAGVKGGSNGGFNSRPPWWTLGGILGGGKKKKKKSKVRESAMSEAGHGLVGGEYRSFEPPATRVLRQDEYGNYMPRTQGPAYIDPRTQHTDHGAPYITAGSYPHGRPLSPVEELRSAAPTPSIASTTAGSPPPQEGQQQASTFQDIPEGAALGLQGPGTPDPHHGSRIPPAAPSTGLGYAAGRDITPPSRQVSNASSTFSGYGYSDSEVSALSAARSSPAPILSQKRKPVRRQFNPDVEPPSTSSSVRSAYNPVSPVSPLSGPSDGPGSFSQQPVPALSPLRHPRIKSSPQYYEDYNR